MTRGHRGSVEIEVRRAHRRRFLHWPRFLKPLCDPGRSDFPNPVLGLGSPRHFSGRAFLHGAKLRCWRTLRPDAVEFAPPLRHDTGPQFSSSASGCGPIVVATECPEPLCPGRALPALGRPRRPPGGALPPRLRSYGLMRQTIPLPAPPVRPSRAGSLQVVASPCCEMALPDIISAILAWVLGPLPRRAPRLHTSASSPRTPASPQSRRVWRAKFPPHGSFRGDIDFEAAVIRSPSGSHAC
jgi:hypothetical protein